MKKILVIEDNLEVREVLEEVLELADYEVILAEDGTVGVKKALDHQPDLIICDVMMPKLDGFGVLNILGKKTETANIPFIFLTAKTDKLDFRRGMKLGADDYITKPFDNEELLEVIEIRLKKSERLKERFNDTSQSLNRFIDEAKGFKELEKLSLECKIKSFGKKETVVWEGNTARYLFFVNRGSVKMAKTNEYGKELIIKIASKGDFFGYTALMTHSPYSFNAIALENKTELSLVPKEDFTHLISANQSVAANLIKMLANNVKEKEDQLLNLAYSSVRKRVANALIYLHEQNNKADKPDIVIKREDLAHLVGTAKESVIRMLSELKADGYIEVKGGHITILAVEKLSGLNV